MVNKYINYPLSIRKHAIDINLGQFNSIHSVDQDDQVQAKVNIMKV